MTWHSLLYLGLLVTCLPYALVRGGAPERIAALVALLATILSGLALARSAIVYQKLEIGTLVVDVMACVAFLAVAVRADRYWPLLVTGLQADAVMIHLCKILQPDMLPFGYAIGLSIWSYPILILLAIATRRHRRRIAEYGFDPSWSSLDSHSGSHPNSVTVKGKLDAGGSSKRVNQNGSGKPLPTVSNGGVQ